MLWSNPKILYDVVASYRIEDYKNWLYYWKLKRDPAVSLMRSNHQVCLLATPSEINHPSILWQHLFLDPLLKIMKTDWHLCLLPRRMVVVIKDGLYICERLASSEKEELIESTKRYLYRFGYEPDTPIEIHDWRKQSETVTIPKNYQGFLLKPHQSWNIYLKNTFSALFPLLSPYITVTLIATLFSLILGCAYYSYKNYHYDFNRIQILRSWSKIQGNKTQYKKLLHLIGLLDEAKTSKSFIDTISTKDDHTVIQCSHEFPPDKNLEILKQFLKKYYPYTINSKNLNNQNIELIV